MALSARVPPALFRHEYAGGVGLTGRYGGAGAMCSWTGLWELDDELGEELSELPPYTQLSGFIVLTTRLGQAQDMLPGD